MSILKIHKEAVIACALCGFEFTHQIKTEIWDRHEDAVTGLHIVSTGLTANISRYMGQGNPSSRRQGLTVTLSCENCDNLTKIMIYQHKGQTCIETAIVAEDEE